jgi:hypothetical protein
MERRTCWNFCGNCSELRIHADIRRSCHCPNLGHGLYVARCEKQRQKHVALDRNHSRRRFVWPTAVFHHGKGNIVNPTIQEWVISLSFAVTGLIHVLPLAGLLGRPMLERAYGVTLGEGHDLTILMQHRALLFGLLAAACFAAVAFPGWRWPAGIAAMVSMAGFVLIAAFQSHGLPIAKVMWIDVGAALLLSFGLLLHFKSGYSI